MIAALFAALAVGAAPSSAPPPAAASAAPAPSPEAMALARRAAARDDFLVMIQSVAGGQVEGVEKGMGDLTPVEKAKVDDIGKRKLDEGIDRVVDKLAEVYAKEFSLDELRAIARLPADAGRKGLLRAASADPHGRRRGDEGLRLQARGPRPGLHGAQEGLRGRGADEDATAGEGGNAAAAEVVGSHTTHVIAD